MKLSEKIITLRNKYQMSQGDLAEKLNVSRQSVSKWETGASIPDLDKLIAMSELFHVTLDELAKEDSAFKQVNDESTITKENVDKQEETPNRNKENTLIVKIVGAILEVVTPIIVMLVTMGYIPGGGGIILFALYFFICGFVCLFSKKNVGRRILIMTLVIVAAIIAVIVWNIGIGVSIS